MEQEQLEETGPPPTQRRKTTVTSQSKAIEERETNCGLEMTKEDALKQFEESEKDAQAGKKFKQAINEHAADKEMLARDDEADTLHSFKSMTDRHWKSIKTFSKLGCVQDIFVFTLTMTFFL